MRFFLIAFIFIISITSHASDGNGQYEVIFGVITNSNGFDNIERDVREIELKPKSTGYRFGFRIIPNTTATYNHYTVTYLPGSPKQMSGVLQGISQNNITSGFKSPEATASGAILIPAWFDEGDPTGLYKMELYINGSLEKTVEFDVSRRQ